jgi:putative ABC transport system permease protein
MGTDFINDGSLIMSAQNFAGYCPHFAEGDDPLSRVTLGIVRLSPNADLEQVKARLQANLPGDVTVYTKQEFIDHELSFWEASSPIGFIFSLGVIIGFVVGVIICYQILYADVSDHLGEFATLKAMGYRTPYFMSFVLWESLYLSVLSFIPALAVSLALYYGLTAYTGLIMILNVPRAAFVFALTVSMCVVSGCLAIRKVRSADPADLF